MGTDEVNGYDLGANETVVAADPPPPPPADDKGSDDGEGK